MKGRGSRVEDGFNLSRKKEKEKSFFFNPCTRRVCITVSQTVIHMTICKKKKVFFFLPPYPRSNRPSTLYPLPGLFRHKGGGPRVRSRNIKQGPEVTTLTLEFGLGTVLREWFGFKDIFPIPHTFTCIHLPHTCIHSCGAVVK